MRAVELSIDTASEMASVALSQQGRLLAEGKVRGPGVLAPEAAFDAQEFLAELDNAGIKVTEELV